MMDIEHQWCKSLELLKIGDPAGWPKHEWIRTGRHDTHRAFEPTPTFGLPVWNGQEDVTLLVNADCGMGDTIHFFRWVNCVKVKKLILRCDQDFAPLLPVETASNESDIPKSDCIIHMMALPRVLGIKKVSGEPYLTSQGSDSCEKLSELTFHKVGVCWSGNPFNPRDESRSIPLLKNICKNMFGLVKHEKPPEGCFDMRGFMQNWNTTAHLLGHMDLIISVDTAIAHLGGALGIPTLLLLPKMHDWRWGNDPITPWYDSIRILRNESGWPDLVDEVNTIVSDPEAYC